MHKQEYKKLDLKRVLIIGISLIVMFLLVFIFSYYSNQKNRLIDAGITELENQYVNTVSVYSEMAQAIFNLGINTRDVKLIVYKAYSADNSDEMDMYRKELHARISDLYTEITKYSFRQLHFHTPENLSFLRMHRPEKYGDDLTGIRYTVEFVNEFHQPITGFEEGRIYNGYRFVFPLEFEGFDIGSVEISVSIKSVIDIVSKRFDYPSQFILKKSIIDEKVFDSEKSNYYVWTANDEFVLDKEIAKNKVLVDGLSDWQIRKIQEGFKESNNESFYVEYAGWSDTYIVFYPIINVKGDFVGYLLSIKDINGLNLLTGSFYIIGGVLFILLLILVYFYLYYTKTQNELLRISTHDYLTGALLRGALIERMEVELYRHRRYDSVFSIIMIDIDHFKLINDTYGHNAGDRVLKNMVAYIKQTIRTSDTIGRYGGEEFIILLPETDREHAIKLARKLNEGIKIIPLYNEVTITISCGVAQCADCPANELIEKADQKLYTAKNTGRDRVVG